DVTGRAVAWGGAAGDLEPERTPSPAGLVASFHVTRFTLAYRSPRVSGTERRGVLIVSRGDPTGILRPGLIEYLQLQRGPTGRRLRARAASRPDRQVALAVGRADPEPGSDDLRRARARFWAVLACAATLAFALLSDRAVAGLVAARAVLLLGTPRADSGI